MHSIQNDICGYANVTEYALLLLYMLLHSLNERRTICGQNIRPKVIEITDFTFDIFIIYIEIFVAGAVVIIIIIIVHIGMLRPSSLSPALSLTFCVYLYISDIT